MSLVEIKPMRLADRNYLKMRYALQLTRNNPAETFEARRDDVLRRCRRRDRLFPEQRHTANARKRIAK
jgi:hypothetical protein